MTWLEEGVRTKEDMSWVDPAPLETFEVSSKNMREHPDYIPPYDPGKDSQGYTKREQSMVFSLTNLASGHCGSVYKLVPDIDDFTLYRKIAFYVHGDSSASSEDVYVFVRMGGDSLNFYEYLTRVDAGWKSEEVWLDDIRLTEGTK